MCKNQRQVKQTLHKETMPKKSVTMTDVARQAGVSISTVSRVINGSVKVSHHLRNQVETAIEELSYQPIRVGSGDRPAPGIAIIVPNIDSSFFHNLVQGILLTCFENSHILQIYSSGDDPEKEMVHASELLLRSDIRGVIFAGPWTWKHEEPILKLEESKLPLCLINRFAPTVSAADVLEVEREQGAYAATTHLLQLGHTQIGCVTGIPYADTVSDKVAGFRRALRDYSIEIDEGWILETNLSAEGGYRAGLDLLTREHRPTAIFARTDRLAIGIMRAARELSIAIPDDLSIVGYDDEPDARFWRPALTTVRQPQYEMGVRAASLLFERIRNRYLPPRQAIIQPQLIVRETTLPTAKTIKQTWLKRQDTRYE